MRVLTTAAADRQLLRAAAADPTRLLVVALCAAWCDTCNEFRVTFERIANSRADIAYAWLDIEDDSTLCGDVDVENFPTLTIWRGETLLFFGVSLPQEGSVARLIDALAVDAPAAAGAPMAVHALRRALGG